MLRGRALRALSTGFSLLDRTLGHVQPLIRRRASGGSRKSSDSSDEARRGLSPADVEAHYSVLKSFTEVYCRDHHGPRHDGSLICEECDDLLSYARRKLERCPYDPKPKCKECETHCYRREYRDRIRAVMRYSGMYFVKRGRLDWLVRYFLLEGLPKRKTRVSQGRTDEH